MHSKSLHALCLEDLVCLDDLILCHTILCITRVVHDGGRYGELSARIESAADLLWDSC